MTSIAPTPNPGPNNAQPKSTLSVPIVPVQNAPSEKFDQVTANNLSATSASVSNNSLNNVALNSVSSVYGVATTGFGVPAIIGIDNRTGLTAADASPITIHSVTGSGRVYRVFLRIYATAYTSGIATYTMTWTENAVTKTYNASVSSLNGYSFQGMLLLPDTASNITVQLTGTFVATVKVTGVVERVI